MSETPLPPEPAAPAASRPRRAWLPPLVERRFGPFVFRWISPRSPSADLEIPLAFIGTIGIACFAFLPLEMFQPFLGSCNFKTLTGWPCMSCGITRAFLAVSHGEFWQAFRMNPLFVLPLYLLFAYTPYAWWSWLAKKPRPRFGFTTTRARWMAALVVVVMAFVNWAFLISDGR